MLDLRVNFNLIFFGPAVFKILYPKEVEDSEFDYLESMGKPISSSKATGKSEGEISIRFSWISKQGLQIKKICVKSLILSQRRRTLTEQGN